MTIATMLYRVENHEGLTSAIVLAEQSDFVIMSEVGPPMNLHCIQWPMAGPEQRVASVADRRARSIALGASRYMLAEAVKTSLEEPVPSVTDWFWCAPTCKETEEEDSSPDASTCLPRSCNNDIPHCVSSARHSSSSSTAAVSKWSLCATVNAKRSAQT
eukprot:CAMPEP_0115502338 /NCGR_PEP_ID=MMETSP0271-20121206/68888_1 /TAXON_ID=71861 /ORGANISM="Scrippsiella trochoidea, Strain CCMP3099" /LENGTH=158 /DNA_ID=CAMNT_0002931353 /DNA_START=978 /DNA_END=1451 /DNA_ORIENTATION=+